MTRYYFDLRDGGGVALDEEGMEMSDFGAVQEEAVHALADMVRDSIRGDNFHQFAIDVRDANGPVLEVALAWHVLRADS